MTKDLKIQSLKASITQLRNARQLINSGSYNVKDAIKAINASNYLKELQSHCQADLSRAEASKDEPLTADEVKGFFEADGIVEAETKD